MAVPVELDLNRSLMVLGCLVLAVLTLLQSFYYMYHAYNGPDSNMKNSAFFTVSLVGLFAAPTFGFLAWVKLSSKLGGSFQPPIN